MKNALRLKTKMTLWYTFSTALLALIFCAALYAMMSHLLDEMLERDVRLAMAQVIAQMENENGLLTFENEVPFSTNVIFFVTEADGSELATYGEDITLFDHLPVMENSFRTVKGKGGDWLLMDSPLVEEDAFAFRVRVAASRELNNRVLSTLLLLFAIGVPVMTLIACIGGFCIARRSLRPVHQIIRSARAIGLGDLTKRIPSAPVNDEIGELTDTLNHMLAFVETAFQREKRFTADASHELRMPVAVMRAYTESLLTDQCLTDEQREALQTTLTECTHMQRIIKQLLTITRGAEGRYPICLECLTMSELTDSVAAELSGAMDAKGIHFTCAIPSSLILTADQSLITQLLLNLVENAIKYGKQGSNILMTASEESEHVKLSLRDDGMGIPPESLPHIFERFYRVDSSRDRSGTGLGLAIAQWIVQAHGGSIKATSKLGKGTEFIILLPK